MKIKDLLKVLLFTLIIGVIIIFFGCSSTKKTTTVIPQEKFNLIDWKQIYVPDIMVGDTIIFYNSAEIIIEGSFLNQDLYLDGAINITNNKKILQKTVPIRTSGELISFNKDNSGRITDMYVKFSLIDKTYIFNFKLTSDGSFSLNGNAKLFFKGKEYPVLATIRGDVCKLLCILNIKENVEYVKEKAEGVIPQ